MGVLLTQIHIEIHAYIISETICDIYRVAIPQAGLLFHTRWFGNRAVVPSTTHRQPSVLRSVQRHQSDAANKTQSTQLDNVTGNVCTVNI